MVFKLPPTIIHCLTTIYYIHLFRSVVEAKLFMKKVLYAFISCVLDFPPFQIRCFHSKSRKA